MIVKEELDGIDTVLMKNVGTLKYSLMVESLIEISTKRRSQVLYRFIDVHDVTNVIGEGISSRSMRNIVNQFGKYDFFFWAGSKSLEREEASCSNE